MNGNYGESLVTTPSSTVKHLKTLLLLPWPSYH